MFSKMAAHLFNESGQMQEVDIPDIFDVLEGGEDESAVKFLLGFNGDDNPGDDGSGLTIATGSPELMNNNGLVQQVLNSSPLSSPTLVEKTSTPARVVVQIEPPTGLANSIVTSPGGTLAATSGGGGTASDQVKTDKPRRREPVDPSRCIYACDSCGKAFTTKFNLKRHINMHCSRSREAGVPIQGPPSASQPSRKHKSKDSTESVATGSTVSSAAASSQIKVRRVSSSNNVVTSSTNTRSLNATSVSVVTSPPNLVKTVTNVGSATVGKTIVTASNPAVASTYQTGVNEQTTSQPMTVQLAVNAAGQPRILTTSAAKPATLPVQPLPESAVQLIQSLNSGSGPGTHRIVRIINAPQIIATQSRGGITTGATVQLQAIPVTVAGNGNPTVTGNGTSISLPTQPIPLVQTVGTRQIVLTNAAANSTSLTRMAHRVADIMPGIAATALDSAQKVSTATPVGLVTSSGSASATLVTNSASSADVLYRSILTSNSPNLTTLTPVTSTTISSPTGGLNCEQPPADLFDSEDGDALSVATTTETPTPPPSLNGDPIAAIKSLPTEKELEIPNMGVATKVVVIQQPPQLCPPPSEDDEDEDMVNSADPGLTNNTASLLPSNRFHGTLTSIPKGWLRKVVTTSKGFQQVFYYNPVGKRFSNQDEVDQYFARLGYSVPTHLFNFELPKLVDEDEDLDDLGSDPEINSDDGSTSAVVVKVTSNAKGEATVTPTTSTVVALPSGTIVTRADTTVGDHLSGPTSAISPTSGSLVTSSKQTLLSSASATKIMLAKTST